LPNTLATMARRSDDVTGSLVYQEGKCIEGEFYIVAVFDDPDIQTVTFSAYELENDCTYSYPVAYSEFRDLFRQNVELMNPSNMDARYHWIVERLDFVLDNRGQKCLCLADEPTPELDDYDPEEGQESGDDAEASVAAAEHKLSDAASGMIDAATRLRLLRELDCRNMSTVQRGMVRSEAARRGFLSDLFQKRQLEQLKAQQRLHKDDADRQVRLAKLAESRKKQQERSEKARAKAEAQKSTMMQLEALKRQKQAADIRKLIASRSQEGQGDERREEARRRKRAQEQQERERKAIEKQRAEQLARNRELEVELREQEIKNRDRAEADKIRERREAERLLQAQRLEEKAAFLAEVARAKHELLLDRQAAREEFERLEEIRDELTAAKDRNRALSEKERLEDVRKHERQEKEQTDKRRQALHNESLLRWRVEARKRAITNEEQDARKANRDRKLQEKEEARLRMFREQQFLESLRAQETMRASSKAFTKTSESEHVPPAGHEQTQLPEELTYEQQERARRHAEAEEQRRQDDLKRSKVEKLGSANPNVGEVARFRDWKKQQEEKDQHLEQIRREHEMKGEMAKKAAFDHIMQVEHQYKVLAPKRREASLERRKKRNDEAVKHTKHLPLGIGLPSTFVY